MVYECVHMCVRVERRKILRDALGRSRNLTQDVEAFLHGVKVFQFSDLLLQLHCLALLLFEFLLAIVCAR